LLFHKGILLAIVTLVACISLVGCELIQSQSKVQGNKPSINEVTIYSFDRHDYSSPDRVLMEIEKKTNTKLSILTGAWDDSQFDVLINTSDYPDILTIVDSNKYGRFNRWVNEGVLIPFDDELLEGLPNLQRVFSQPEYQSLKINGKFYALPLKDEFPEGSPGQFVLTIRKDWLDKLQLPIPQTLEQFYETMNAFTSLSSDVGDSSNKTYGIITNSLPQLVKNIMGSWGVPVDERSSGFLKVANDYEYWVIQPEVKEALRYVRGLYTDGLIHMDSLSIDTNDKLRPKFLEGNIGAMFDSLNYEELYKRNEQLRKHIPDAEIIDIPALKGPSERWGYSKGSGFWGYTVITNKASNPKAAATVLDYLLSEEGKALTLYGVPDVHYRLLPSGELELNLEERKLEPGFEAESLYSPHELNWGLVQWSDMTSPQYLKLRALADSNYEALVKENSARVNQYLIEPASYNLSTPLWIAFRSNSDLMYAEYFNKIILGELNIDEGFDEFVSKWLDSGGREAMQEMNTAMKSDNKL